MLDDEELATIILRRVYKNNISTTQLTRLVVVGDPCSLFSVLCQLDINFISLADPGLRSLLVIQSNHSIQFIARRREVS